MGFNVKPVAQRKCLDSRGFAGFDKGEETVRKGGRAHSSLRQGSKQGLTWESDDEMAWAAREYEDEVELDQMGPVKRLKSRRIV